MDLGAGEGEAGWTEKSSTETLTVICEQTVEVAAEHWELDWRSVTT